MSAFASPSETIMVLTDLDRKLIELTQAGLPLVARPYHQLAGQMGISADEVMCRLQHMQDCGVIRRIAAVPNHYKLGFRANGMTVWDVDDAEIQRLGPQVGALDFVSHCYQRPRHLPLWSYNFLPWCTVRIVMMFSLTSQPSGSCWASTAASMTSCFPPVF